MGGVVFDEKFIDFDFRDFSNEAYSRFLKKAKIDNNLDCKQLLSNLGFFKNNKLNYSGILLFSKDITEYLRNATIQCVLYQGTDSTIIDKKEFSRDLLSNFEDDIKYIKSKLNTEYVIKSTQEYYNSMNQGKLKINDILLVKDGATIGKTGKRTGDGCSFLFASLKPFACKGF